MNTDSSAFDSKAAKWKEREDQPGHWLRYSLAHENLCAHLQEGTLSILDVGGGDGLDAVPLAKDGHNVGLLDLSEKMLEIARENARKEQVEGRMTFHHASVDALPVLFPAGSCDVVLCHSVLSYLDDPGQMLRSIHDTLCPGGTLSLLSLNRYSEPMVAAVSALDFDEAHAKLDAKSRQANLFDVPIRLYSAEELVALVESHGFELVQQYGVLCVWQILQNEALRAPSSYAKLEELERAMSTEFPYYLHARFCQIIAVKAG